jgi:hypothetical protein
MNTVIGLYVVKCSSKSKKRENSVKPFPQKISKKHKKLHLNTYFIYTYKNRAYYRCSCHVGVYGAVTKTLSAFGSSEIF